MDLESPRLELPDPAGNLIVCPSFVRQIREYQPGDYLYQVVDCWAPIRSGDDGADYRLGRDHFAATLDLSRRWGAAGFLFNVLAAMMARREVQAIESGFLDALVPLASVGVRPAPIDQSQLPTTPLETIREWEDIVWCLIECWRETDEPGQLRRMVELAIVDPQGTSDVIRLWVVAATAFSGRLN